MIDWSFQRYCDTLQDRMREVIHHLPSGDLTVCFTGGRDFCNGFLFSVTMHNVIMTLHNAPGDLSLRSAIVGGAPGADTMGERWARRQGLIVRKLPARWKAMGKAAGVMRNGDMVEALQSTRGGFVIGFPGGPGTADMLMKTDMAGIPYIDTAELLDEAEVSPSCPLRA